MITITHEMICENICGLINHDPEYLRDNKVRFPEIIEGRVMFVKISQFFGHTIESTSNFIGVKPYTSSRYLKILRDKRNMYLMAECTIIIGQLIHDYTKKS